jgi:hypothetical protein
MWVGLLRKRFGCSHVNCKNSNNRFPSPAYKLRFVHNFLYYPVAKINIKEHSQENKPFFSLSIKFFKESTDKESTRKLKVAL